MNPAVQVAIESDGGVGYRDLPNQSRTAAGTILMRNLCKQGQIVHRSKMSKETETHTNGQT